MFQNSHTHTHDIIYELKRIIICKCKRGAAAFWPIRSIMGFGDFTFYNLMGHMRQCFHHAFQLHQRN